MTHPALLAKVIITSSNNAIRFQEGITPQTVSIAAGNYFLRGDGSSSDLCKVIKDALDSHTGSNVYAVSADYSADPTDLPAKVTVSRASGPNNFAMLLAQPQTTFDPGLIGLPAVDQSSSSASRVSDRAPSCAWVSNEIYESIEDWEKEVIASPVAKSGFVRPVKNADTHYGLSIDFQLVDPRRAFTAKNTAANRHNAFSAFKSKWAAARMEIHELPVASGFYELSPPTTSTRRSGPSGGTHWHFDAETISDFSPRASDLGVPLYDFSIGFLEAKDLP